MSKEKAGLKPAVFSKNNLQYEGTREDVVKAIKAVKEVKVRRKKAAIGQLTKIDFGRMCKNAKRLTN